MVDLSNLKVTGEKSITKNKHYKVINTIVGPYERKVILEVNRRNMPRQLGKKTKFYFDFFPVFRNPDGTIIKTPEEIRFFVTLVAHAKGALTSGIRYGVIKLGDSKFGKKFKESGYQSDKIILEKRAEEKDKKITEKIKKTPWLFHLKKRKTKTRLPEGVWAYDKKETAPLFKYKGKQLKVRTTDWRRPLEKWFDFEFIIGFDPETKIESNNDPDVLNILQYNIQLLPIVAKMRLGQIERASLMHKLLGGWDVISIQEELDPLVAIPLKKSMEKAGYKYHTSVLGAGLIKGLAKGKPGSGGVRIFSRFPIKYEDEEYFGKNCKGADCTAQKGIKYAAIVKTGLDRNRRYKGRVYHIFSSHTQSDAGVNPGDNADIRKKQFQQMRNFVKKKNVPKHHPVIFIGDLNVVNVDKKTEGAKDKEGKKKLERRMYADSSVEKMERTSEYKDMLETLNANDFDITANPLLDGSGTEPGTIRGGRSRSTPQQLDYILISRDHLQPEPGTVEMKVFYDFLLEPWYEPKGLLSKVKALVISPDQNTKTHPSDHMPLGMKARFDQKKFQDKQIRRELRLKKQNYQKLIEGWKRSQKRKEKHQERLLKKQKQR